MASSTAAAALPLSVVIVTLGGRRYVPRCLDALAAQEDAPQFEIIVPCDDRITDRQALRKQYPQVRFIDVEGRKTYAELRARGFREAKGTIIALTEDHCSPYPRWCATLMKELQNDYAAVGGPVDKSGGDTALNWGIYLSDFGRYMSPVPEGESQYLTDCNVAYKRAILEEIADLWQEEFHETTVNWRLKELGYHLQLCPQMVVHQQRSLSYRAAFRERYAFGRLFASTRVAATSFVKRIIYTLLVVLLPALIVLRAAKNVFQKKRAIGQFFISLPAITFLGLAWSWGELVGYITGQPEQSLNPDF